MVLTLCVEHLRFSYGGGVPLLSDVSFEVAAGDVIGLLGPNGSGKTTLLRCLLGMHRTAAGTIRVWGRELTALTTKQVARELAYVPQDTAVVLPYTALDVVLMGRSPHLRFMAGPTTADRHCALAAMDQLGIAHLAARRFPELSGGERQMVLIARALAQGSTILIMDEPTAGLDYGNQVRILHTVRALARQGYSILLSSHIPEHAFLVCNKVALLENGRLRGPGPPQEILTDHALSDLYGTAIRVLHVRLPESPTAELSLCVPVMDDQEDVDGDMQSIRVLRDARLPAVGPGQCHPGS
jgi:iron complex transport system ATP-binding protein